MLGRANGPCRVWPLPWEKAMLGGRFGWSQGSLQGLTSSLSPPLSAGFLCRIKPEGWRCFHPVLKLSVAHSLGWPPPIYHATTHLVIRLFTNSKTNQSTREYQDVKIWRMEMEIHVKRWFSVWQSIQIAVETTKCNQKRGIPSKHRQQYKKLRVL